MMSSKSKGFLTRVLMFAMLAFVALPTAAFAQDRRNQDNDQWRRNEDQRRRDRDRNDDRWDNNNDDRRDNNRDRRNRNRRNRNDDGYGNFGGSFNLRQTALNAGFADGAKEGRKDRSRNERFDFRDESGFQKATRDYSSQLGNRELYRTYYRQAFENGYRDGFAGY